MVQFFLPFETKKRFREVIVDRIIIILYCHIILWGHKKCLETFYCCEMVHFCRQANLGYILPSTIRALTSYVYRIDVTQ